MPASRPPEPPRLIDLRAEWLVQYAPETTLFDEDAAEVARREMPRVEGYLGATSLAVVMVGSGSHAGDPWATLGDRIARVEAEFCGRLLTGPDDVARWRDDPHGLTWGIMGVAGLDALIGSTGPSRLGALLDRGVRVLQIASGAEEDRGLTDLDLMFLDDVTEWVGMPRPILDLAGMGPRRASGTLSRFKGDEGLRGRVGLMRSFGPIVGEGEGGEILRRLRALGGFVALGASSRSFETAEALRAGFDAVASMPFAGRIGHEGIGVATDLFGGGASLKGLETAPALAAWVMRSFDPPIARALLRGNAEAAFSGSDPRPGAGESE
jgi:hypothetical protein